LDDLPRRLGGGVDAATLWPGYAPAAAPVGRCSRIHMIYIYIYIYKHVYIYIHIYTDVFIDEEAPGCLWCLAAGSYK